MEVKKRLGEMLIESNLLSQEQLQSALAEQRKTGLKLGQFLVRGGVVGENQIVDMLCRQLKIERYHPDKYPVDMDLARLISVDVAQKYQLAPLKKKAGF